MTLEVLSVLQSITPSNPVDAGPAGEGAPNPELGSVDFATVFSRLLPTDVQGQGLAADPELSTAPQGEEAADSAPDPALAWLTLAPMTTGTVVAAGLQATALGTGQMQLITPSQPSADVDGDSLMAFAQGQGLDEGALKRLFGESFKPEAAAAKAAVVPAAAWIAGGQRNLVAQTPAPDTEAAQVEVALARLPLDRTALSLLPVKRLTEPNPSRASVADAAKDTLLPGEDGRVELELDVGSLLPELSSEGDLKALKAEERAALSVRIGELLAQRMVAQAQRGQWQLRLALNPQNLGRIEIDMQMRGGELEATFGAMNPITRDLLQDGLPRLREMLQQSGMDVASLNIGSGGSSKNGGQPTPQAMDDRAGGPSGSTDAQAAVPAQAKRSVGADGWDIWV